MKVTQAFTFEAAHYLPHVHEDHKCKNMHGHSYRVELTYQGEINEIGFVIDFFQIERLDIAPLKKELDHRILNDIRGLENPTAENIALWIKGLTSATSVRVYETPMCWAEC